jgi:hypothetical protein
MGFSKDTLQVHPALPGVYTMAGGMATSKCGSGIYANSAANVVFGAIVTSL